MTFTIFLAQVAGGVISGSLVLLSDPMHMLADFTGLMIALIAILIGRSTATYNHRRVEVFTALINATIVSAISVMIVVRALGRIGEQVPLDTGVMLIVAMVGLAANAISALILGRRQHESLNMRGVYLRVLSDLLGSVAVIIAVLIIRFTSRLPADIIASLFIAAMVLPRPLRLMVDSLAVLMNHTPKNIDARDVEATLLGLPGSLPRATCRLGTPLAPNHWPPPAWPSRTWATPAAESSTPPRPACRTSVSSTRPSNSNRITTYTTRSSANTPLHRAKGSHEQAETIAN
ncbi:cation diffusion facilitator family transporter [Corynebacterium sanguinis]|uniref:cation diffusion facilitator family transporter n=1 Tax=Corynebacterium sanguinis TaxID=2594913 RepID=UPI0028831CEC|nr:cation diffusion facilitator family transporter [Corynebacterium sanguinis]